MRKIEVLCITGTCCKNCESTCGTPSVKAVINILHGTQQSHFCDGTAQYSDNYDLILQYHHKLKSPLSLFVAKDPAEIKYPKFNKRNTQEEWHTSTMSCSDKIFDLRLIWPRRHTYISEPTMDANMRGNHPPPGTFIRLLVNCKKEEKWKERRRT